MIEPEWFENSSSIGDGPGFVRNLSNASDGKARDSRRYFLARSCGEEQFIIFTAVEHLLDRCASGARNPGGQSRARVRLAAEAFQIKRESVAQIHGRI